ncbi:MAG TPA: L,D-transpeptidase family protein [Stenomitos sp.]
MSGAVNSTLFGAKATPKEWQPRSFRSATPDADPTPRPARDRLDLGTVSSQARAPQSASFRNARFSAHAELVSVLAGAPLTTGAKGEGVKAVQQALLDLGFAVDGGADGAFGGKTAQALKNFQESQHLPASGLLDAKTLRALDEVAPAPGLKAWEDPALSPKAIEQPQVVRGKMSRVVVGIAQHRLFMFDSKGQLQKIFPIASGKRGTDTDPGIKVVDGKLADPSGLARQLWPESGGRAFGTRLVGLSWLDANTGRMSNSGEELHGTFDRSSIGTYASHGCMRLYNENIEEVYQQLKAGDVVVVRP